MELKVWVEGIQRVVCGITEQTTVQEVVIALAQATGRTGRYTLVEKWRDMEKLLPPSECPVKVLEKFGEYAAEVEFLLKRTGASTASSDVETVKGPERNIYRQSLPPLVKSRDKSEILQGLRRKEPKRKSLTITGSARTQCTEDVVAGKANKNSNANNNTFGTENALVGPNAIIGVQLDKKTDQRPRQKTEDMGKREKTLRPIPINTNLHKPEAITKSSSTATQALFPTKSESQVVAKSPTRKSDNMIKNLKTGKKVPLMPPSSITSRSHKDGSSPSQQLVPGHTGRPFHSRNLSSGSLTPNPFSIPNENKVNYAYRHGNSLPRSKKKLWSDSSGATTNEKKPEGAKVPLMPPDRKRAITPNPQSYRENKVHSNKDVHFSSLRGTDGTKATGNFSRLIVEQQKHLEEQQDTISALEKEIKFRLDEMQRNEKAVNDEIAVLDEKTYMLEQQCSDGKDVALELSMIDGKVDSLQRNMDALSERLQLSTDNLDGYKKKIIDLKQAISEESRLQRMMEEKQIEITKHMLVRNKNDIGNIHRKLTAVRDEICRLEKDSDMVLKEIESKKAKYETLSRELRQVNLQHFIRRTGSKVTVLPPSREDVETAERQSKQNVYHTNPLNVSGPSPPAEGGFAEGVWV